MKNSKEYLQLKGPYPTRFSYFGLSYEQVEEMIDNKINEDRQQKAPIKIEWKIYNETNERFSSLRKFTG